MFHTWYLALELHFVISVACMYNMRETKVCVASSCNHLVLLNMMWIVCEDVG